MKEMLQLNYRNTKDQKKLLLTFILQQIAQTGKNGYIPRHIQSSKIES